MMKVLKWIFILVIGVVVLTLLASWILAKKFNSEFEKTYSFTPSQIQLPLREGEYFLSDAEHAMMLI